VATHFQERARTARGKYYELLSDARFLSITGLLLMSVASVDALYDVTDYSSFVGVLGTLFTIWGLCCLFATQRYTKDRTINILLRQMGKY
jgi:hypothetical protein